MPRRPAGTPPRTAAERAQSRIANAKGPDRQDWMTSGELCRWLNTSPRTFRKWQQAKKVPEPAARTNDGYGLWSPDQQNQILRERRITL